MISVHQHLRRAQSAKLRGPRVMRIVEQTARAMLRARNFLNVDIDLRVRRAKAFILA